MSEWQPIETAPDEVGILLTDGTSIVGIGAWFEGRWVFWDGGEDTIFWPEDEGREMSAELNYWVKGYGPTHWMPLPELPE